MNFEPPAYNSDIFNSGLFNTLDETVTIDYANEHYLQLSGGTVRGPSTFNAGLSINGTLNLNGSLVDLSTISGVINGTALADKALIVDASRDITNINTITSSNVNVNSNLTYQGSNIDLNVLSGAIAGTADVNKALVLDGSRNIQNINNITATGRLATTMTSNSTSLTNVQQWLNNSTIPVISRVMLNNSAFHIGTWSNHPSLLMTNSTEKMRINAGGNVSIGNTNDSFKLDVSGASMTTSLKIRQTGSGNTDVPNFTFDTSSSAGYSGLRIAPDALNLANLSCMGFYNAGYSTLLMYLASNGTQNCVHLRPTSSADVSVSMANTGLCVGNNAIVRGGMIVSGMSLTNSNNTVPQTKFRVIGDTDYVDGSYQKVAEFCNSTYGNALSIQCSTTSGSPIYLGGLNGSDIRFGTSNSTTMTLTDTGHLLIGTTSDIAPFVVSGSQTFTVSSITTTTYRYNVATNTYSNLGVGPVSFSISAYFSSNIFVQNSIYTTSDRRLKENIKPLELTLEHYNKLKPVSYKYKNETNTKLGLIAQDCLSICSEMVGYSENEKMKKENQDDIEGFQYTIDYNQLSVMNCSAIKLLIKELNELKSIVNKLNEFSALKNFTTNTKK